MCLSCEPERDGHEIKIERHERRRVEDGDTACCKVISCKLLKNPVPVALRAVVDANKITPVTEMEWTAERFDEKHPCKYVVRTPAFGSSVTVEGRQWLVEKGESECVVCTRFAINCTLPAIGGVVEQIVADLMAKAYGNCSERCVEFAKQRPDFLDDGATAVQLLADECAEMCLSCEPDVPHTPKKCRVTGFLQPSRSHMVLLNEPATVSDLDAAQPVLPCGGCVTLCVYLAFYARRKWRMYRRVGKQTVAVPVPPADLDFATKGAELGILD